MLTVVRSNQVSVQKQMQSLQLQMHMQALPLNDIVVFKSI